MLLVGVTGSIGMGKSTVAQMFKEHGYGVYNADDTVHYIYENDEEVIEKVERQFPGSTKDGAVNRLALRDILNKDPDKFRDLEQIVHPVTRKYQIIYIKKLIEEGKMGCVLDIPLLFETGGEKYVDVSVVVTASEATQQSRVVLERKVPLEIFNAIKDQQMPDRDKLKKADYIISTDNNIEDTKSEVKEVAAKIKLINPKAWNTFFNQ
ncbi:MAG: dephospho-CoA kinase [Candidatus Pelagibacterales bacterium]|nr:MAG: dephospho-CoA kinase [Pelagibacterales bacterium]